MPIVERQILIQSARVAGRGGEQAVSCCVRLQNRAARIGRHQPLEDVEREHG